MAQIGQYQLGSFASPINGGALDANVVRGNDNSIVGVHDNHDNDPTIHVQSFPFASLPSASTLGRFLIASDTYRAYFDTGSVLQEIAYLSKTGGAITGNLAISGTLGAGGTVTVSNGDGNFTHTSTNSQVSVNSSGGSGRAYAMISRTTGDFAIRDVSASADRLTIAAGGATSILSSLTVTGALLPSATATYDLGATGTRWNSLFLSAGIAATGTITAGAFSGPLTGNVTGNVTGSAATVSSAAQPAITSVGTLTSLGVSGNVTIGGTLGVTGLSTLSKIKGAGSTPTVNPGAQAGTGATSSAAGTDVAGKITLTTGTGPTAGALVTLTFTSAYATTPFVQLTAGSAGLAIPSTVFVSTTGFTVLTASGTPTASSTYEYFYHVIA